MAGHSHSANIKHRKNAVDAKRAKIFSKLARAIISGARQGGGDPETNLKLKYAVEKAKAANMPKDNIERAIKRGAGDDKDGDAFEELIYEGYGPGGVALMVSCLTDNRNRTAPDIKYIFEKKGGNMGATGSVNYMFDFRSIFVAETGGKDEDALMEIGLEAGADDVIVDGDIVTYMAEATEFIAVKAALEAAGVTFVEADTGHVPQNTVAVEDKDEARKVLRLVDTLEDNDDVQNVYSNFEIPDDWIAEFSS